MALFRKSSRPQAPAPSRPVSVPAAAGDASTEARVQQIGADFLARARSNKAGLLSTQFYSDALMNWSMKDQNFKVQLFRFVDAFPTLKTPEDVFDHLKDYLSQPGVTVPAPIGVAIKAGGLAKGLAAGQMSKQITGMASKFIAGTDAASALPNLKKLWEDGIAFSVDLLGEACLSDEEADHYQKKYLDLIENLPRAVAGWKPNPRLESDHLGPIPRTNVSIKISSLSARCDPIDTEGSIRDLMTRLLPILESARDKGVFINFDMEQFALKDLTIELFQRCVEKVDRLDAGIAMQAYLKSGEADARRMVEWAKRTGKRVTVRLVKGAYWDYHVIHSEQMGWPCPVWPVKRQTDACFERMTDIFLDASPPSPSGRGQGEGSPPLSPSSFPSSSQPPSPGGIKLALGSHNARSIAYALAGLEKRGLPQSALELQMLHGMADQLKYAAADMGLRIREYVPVGDMIPGMAYLVRRLLENTSNESWLKAGFLDNADTTKLLASPHLPPSPSGRGQGEGSPSPSSSSPSYSPYPNGSPSSNGTTHTPTSDRHTTNPERHHLSPAPRGVGNNRPFFNEPFRDFSQKDQRDAFAAAVAAARVPVIANDRTPAQAAQMVAAADRAFPAWRDTAPEARAAVLTRTAELMRHHRDELSAVMIKEAGKTWREADADTAEAIDFCEYYARLAVPLFHRHRLGAFLGELDEVFYQPRGVAVVIAPWNFPLAICTGMTTAALVTGNTVVCKPAEQTPAIARLMFDLLQQALKEGGHSPDVLHFCPAPGETTGAALVRDPRVHLIAFTGSRDVGLDILHAAAPRSPFPSPSIPGSLDPSIPTHIKRVICEMGGKNAVIVDTSADLDEAVLGVRHSAFGFQGQKCSAASRLIVVDPAGPQGPHIRTVVHRLTEATRALVIGDPTRPGTDIGPVIDAEAQQKILWYIQKAKDEGCTLELALELPPVLPPLPEGGGWGKGSTEAAVRGHGPVATNPGIPLTPGDRSNTTAPHAPPSLTRHYVGPHIFSNVRPDHTIAKEEIFGPVLAVMHAHTFQEALDLANASPYKLTGAVYSRKPAHLEQAKREFRVGNLYLNRGSTGALVARQPFGGFGMSGVGSKAGGADYLLQFVEPRALCENTMRRGFAPEL